MSNVTTFLEKLVLEVEGAHGVLLADSETGMILGRIDGTLPTVVGEGADLDTAAASATDFVRAKLKTVKSLGLAEEIEDILTSMGTQYHIIRPIDSNPSIFMYMILDRARANLGLARIAVKAAGKNIKI